jgi:hypothetical protein
MIGMFMRWEGLTAEQYDEVRGVVRWEEDVPQGARFHCATFDDGGARIFDIWDSAEDFQRFIDERIMPAAQEAGLTGEPQVEINETHAVFNPGIDRS